MSIPVVNDLTDECRVLTVHTNEATYAHSPDGRLWVRKRVAQTGTEEFFSELLAGLLGRELGVPLPFFAACVESGEQSFLSECIVPVAAHWHPELAGSVGNLAELGATFALDAIVVNPDRHARNILLAPVEETGVYRAWAIDQGQSMLGWVHDFVGLGPNDLPSIRNVAHGIPLESIRDGARSAASRCTSLSLSLVGDWIDEVAHLTQWPVPDGYQQMLHRRLQSAQTLVATYLDALGDLS